MRAVEDALRKARDGDWWRTVAWQPDWQAWTVPSRTEAGRFYVVKRVDRSSKGEWWLTLRCDCPTNTVNQREVCWHKAAVVVRHQILRSPQGEQVQHAETAPGERSGADSQDPTPQWPGASPTGGSPGVGRADRGIPPDPRRIGGDAPDLPAAIDRPAVVRDTDGPTIGMGAPDASPYTFTIVETDGFLHLADPGDWAVFRCDGVLLWFTKTLDLAIRDVRRGMGVPRKIAT